MKDKNAESSSKEVVACKPVQETKAVAIGVTTNSNENITFCDEIKEKEKNIHSPRKTTIMVNKTTATSAEGQRGKQINVPGNDHVLSHHQDGVLSMDIAQQNNTVIVTMDKSSMDDHMLLGRKLWDAIHAP
ncbi:hypothetical protein E2542_SST13066 [Spatholobus suberectus]|nr:hypothetical protein E2542_SST13066 [Spatholobus suberectus]